MDGNAGVGVVVVSEGHVAGTRGLCIVSSAVTVIGISVVREISGVGVRCVYVFGSGRPRRRWG